jgi:uncharacterized protein YbjQ (UPF0145 family)
MPTLDEIKSMNPLNAMKALGIEYVDGAYKLRSGQVVKDFHESLRVALLELNPASKEQAAAQAVERAEQEKNNMQAMASMLITSGFNFDGYTITKYSGYISGDSAISMDRPTQGWLGDVNKEVGEDLLAGLSQIRRKALQELKEAALALGCNAVIGVDFDYLTLDPETATRGGGTLYLPFLFAVTANGNAVVIEKK